MMCNRKNGKRQEKVSQQQVIAFLQSKMLLKCDAPKMSNLLKFELLLSLQLVVKEHL